MSDKKAQSIALILILLALAAWPWRRAAAQAPGITAPAAGDTLTGLVAIQGTATHPQFLRFELAFRRDAAGGDWIVFAQGDQQVIGGTLGLWDTTVGLPANPVFPDGRYQLRLRVVRTDYNYDEYFVTDLNVANLGGTPTPSPSPSVPSAAVPTPAGQVTLPPAPDVLPSLTPFPSPTPLAVPTDAVLGPLGAGEGETGGGAVRGVFNQLRAIDPGRFGRAVVVGMGLVAIVFAALGLYLVIRGLFRWLWRTGRRWAFRRRAP
jgi:hypothetical protein